MTKEPRIPCTFRTERLIVAPLSTDEDLNALAVRAMEILSPEVTKSMPPGWQSIDDANKASDWIQERDSESTFLLVKSRVDDVVQGFIFLYIEDENLSAIRFGYLFGQESWGKGLGTEVLRGFVDWARKNGSVKSISGGVEKTNIGSIKVLEKVGFIELGSNSDTIFYEYRFE